MDDWLMNKKLSEAKRIAFLREMGPDQQDLSRVGESEVNSFSQWQKSSQQKRRKSKSSNENRRKKAVNAHVDEQIRLKQQEMDGYNDSPGMLDEGLEMGGDNSSQKISDHARRRGGNDNYSPLRYHQWFIIHSD